MNAPVLALIGQIPHDAIGKGLGHLHEIRDQAGIIARLVDHSAHIDGPAEAPAKVAKAIASMRQGRPGPAALECAIDVWGKRGAGCARRRRCRRAAPRIDEDTVRAAAKLLGKAKRVLIVAGGGAQDASSEVTQLSRLLQAPVLAYRRGRGVLDGRDPFSVTLPLGRELWGEADAVLAHRHPAAQSDRRIGASTTILQIVRVDADREEPARLHKPKVALIGDAAPILRQLIDELAKYNARRASRRDEMLERQAKLRQRLAKLAPQLAFLDVDPRRTAGGRHLCRRGDADRLCRPPRLSGLQAAHLSLARLSRTISAGAMPPRSARNTRGRDVPVLSINGDGGFLYTGNELATAMRHRIPLVAVVFADGAFGNVRRIQEERLRQPADRVATSPIRISSNTPKASAPPAGARATRRNLARRSRPPLPRREPTLIEVPVGPMPSPWEFIHMPRVRGP